MKKEIRAEIRILRKAQRQIARDHTAELKRLGRLKRQVENSLSRTNRTCNANSFKITRRIAILEGRLS